MSGIFGNGTASTNEEFKKVIKSRMMRMLFLFGIGCLTIAVSYWAKDNQKVNLSDHMLGIYSGVGTGLAFGAAILWIRNFMVLRDDAKLKQSRLVSSDERIHEISMRAFRVAGYVLVVALYAAGLIGGLFYPVLVDVLFGLASIFALTYVIAYRCYFKIM